MLTRLVRISLLAELAAYVALGAWLHLAFGWGPWRVVLAAVACALATRLALVLLTSLHGWMHRSPREPRQRLGPGGTLRLVASEFAAMVANNFVRLPFEPLVVRRDPDPVAGGGVPVVMLHGYLSNRSLFLPMLKWLEARGVAPVFLPNYRSVASTIEEGVRSLHGELERIGEGTGQRAVLVCHSMGGLIARSYLQKHGQARVARLVTIASPHNGTAMARLAFGPHARQMEPGSGFLAALARAEASRPPTLPTLSIYSVHDNLVSPQDTSRLPWARNEALAGMGHVGILASPEAFELVMAELRAAGAAPAP